MSIIFTLKEDDVELLSRIRAEETPSLVPPALVLFLFLQRRVGAGMTAGAVKG